MRCLILSDLHLEIWRDMGPSFDARACHADIVILAGDIHTGTDAVDWAGRTFPEVQVLYVHGNHEGYGHKLEAMQREVHERTQIYDNVHFLDCGEYLTPDVRFLGATMWTDFALFGQDRRMAALWEANDVMNDYRRIRLEHQGYRKLRAEDTATMHARHKAWLSNKLSEPFPGKTVVISHMAPSMRSVPEIYRESLISAAYASNLDALASQANLWVHGHTHDSFDYQIGQCRVVCNPCGYIMRDGSCENRAFDPNFVVEL